MNNNGKLNELLAEDNTAMQIEYRRTALEELGKKVLSGVTEFSECELVKPKTSDYGKTPDEVSAAIIDAFVLEIARLRNVVAKNEHRGAETATIRVEIQTVTPDAVKQRTREWMTAVNVGSSKEQVHVVKCWGEDLGFICNDKARLIPMNSLINGALHHMAAGEGDVVTAPATTRPEIQAVEEKMREREAELERVEEQLRELESKRCTGSIYDKTLPSGNVSTTLNHTAGETCPSCGRHPEGKRLRKYLGAKGGENETKAQEKIDNQATYEQLTQEATVLRKRLQRANSILENIQYVLGRATKMELFGGWY